MVLIVRQRMYILPKNRAPVGKGKELVFRRSRAHQVDAVEIILTWRECVQVSGTLLKCIPADLEVGCKP